MKLYKAMLIDRLPLEKGELSLNHRSKKVVFDMPTSQLVHAIDKRDAYHKIKNQFQFERIVIENVEE